MRARNLLLDGPLRGEAGARLHNRQAISGHQAANLFGRFTGTHDDLVEVVVVSRFEEKRDVLLSRVASAAED